MLIRKKIAALVICGLCFSFLLPNPSAFASDYLVGIFGIPKGDWSILQKAGLNSAIITEKELADARSLPIKKIYHLGLNPRALNKGVNENELIKRMDRFRSLHDAYNYYLAGDMNCARKSKLDYYRNLLKIKLTPMVCLLGKKAGDRRCYPDYDAFIYHYPLMRRKTPLNAMLQSQTDIVKEGRNKTYVFVQAHPQLWYRKVTGFSKSGNKGLLYPDGQVTIMNIYYGIATGGKGYFLYNDSALSGEESRERLLGAAQAILETRPLTPSLANSSGAEYFQKSSNVFGTKIKGDKFDLFFVFQADSFTNYHPATKKLTSNIKDILPLKNYKAVYQYSPLGPVPVTGAVEVPQDHALILVAFKDKVEIEPLKLDHASLGLYAQILQSRAEKLAANMNAMGMQVPPLKIAQGSLTTRVNSAIKYTDSLNEMKRSSWIKLTGGNLPMDGDHFHTLFYKKQLNAPVKTEFFNFYYR